jgi:hypothetical protein
MVPVPTPAPISKPVNKVMGGAAAGKMNKKVKNGRNLATIRGVV